MARHRNDFDELIAAEGRLHQAQPRRFALRLQAEFDLDTRQSVCDAGSERSGARLIEREQFDIVDACDKAFGRRHDQRKRRTRLAASKRLSALTAIQFFTGAPRPPPYRRRVHIGANDAARKAASFEKLVFSSRATMRARARLESTLSISDQGCKRGTAAYLSRPINPQPALGMPKMISRM